MILARGNIISSIVRKPTHEPKFYLGRKLFVEINAKIEAGESVKVDEIAARLAQEYQRLSFDQPDLYGNLYSNILVVYYPRNEIPEEELREMEVLKIIDGIDLLLAFRNEELKSLDGLDVAIYVRDQDCTYNKGEFNSNVLVSQLRNLKPFYLCRKPREKRKDKLCGAMGRSGYLLELKR